MIEAFVILLIVFNLLGIVLSHLTRYISVFYMITVNCYRVFYIYLA